MSRVTAPDERTRIILIVDDMPANLSVLVEHLEGMGYRVLIARDSEEALERADLTSPDLILLDVLMPNIDGFETCRRLKAAESTRDIPVIFMTCLTDVADKLVGFKAGGVDYITKPFEIGDVIARVTAHLSLREAQKEIELKNAQLQRAHQELEQRVRDRTADLASSNAALRESQRLLQAIVDNSMAVIYVKDIESRYLMVNRRYEELFHVTQQSAIGKTDHELFPKERADAFRAFDRWVMAAGASLEAEEIMPQDDGPHTYISIKCPLLDETGRPCGVCGISTDITERKRAEAEREMLLNREQEARAELERTSRLKDEFLAMMSHELRTPLTAILGWSQLLLTRRTSSAEDPRRGLETIERNARAQSKLIDDLLDMSRIIAGRLYLEVEEIKLAAVIEAVLASMEPAAKAKGIRLEFSADAVAGQCMGDPHRLQQIVWNLVSNAIKFTPQGGHVMVSLHYEDSRVQLAVSDTGMGIEPEFLPHVFERFRQADTSSKRQYGGLGLGLSIVRHLAELHGGTVEVASAGKNQGTSFTVRLPTARHAEVDSGRRPASALHRRPFSHSDGEVLDVKGVRVLVVDDEPDARDPVLKLLAEHLEEVLTASSVAEALAELDRGQPMVLVSDISMPQKDGYVLIRKVRQSPEMRGGSVPA